MSIARAHGHTHVGMLAIRSSVGLHTIHPIPSKSGQLVQTSMNACKEPSPRISMTLFNQVNRAFSCSEKIARARKRLQKAYYAHRARRLALEAANGYNTIGLRHREDDMATELARLDVACAVAHVIKSGFAARVRACVACDSSPL
jgi:hypothetical protein